MGFALGISRFSKSIVIALTFAYGGFVILWQIGNTINQNSPWLDRILTLSHRLKTTVFEIISNQPVRDPIFFLFIMAVVFWLLSVFTCFSLTRYGDAWAATIIGEIAIFTIQIFDGLIASRCWYLAFYIFTSMIIIARMNFIKHQKEWKAYRVSVPSYTGSFFIRSTAFSIAILILVAWTIPTLTQSIPSLHNMWVPLQNSMRQKIPNSIIFLLL